MIPPFERCPKRPARLTATGEHVVMERDTTFDGLMWFGWCKFCGAAVYAHDQVEHWHPYQSYIIREEPEVTDLIATINSQISDFRDP